MKLKLSKRLELIIDMCDYCDTIIDVGTDHGKVPITIANRGLAKNVIAIDNKKGPLKSCEENAKLFLINKEVTFNTLLSDGLSNVEKDISCAIIISGIGYDNMIEILHDIDERNFTYLILSPHTKIEKFIEFLSSKKIKIVEHRQIFEDNKNYNIIKAVKDNI
ncbi:MAG: SAM-dependent methyltransferase [Lachnospiraceae bacterium]|nr:SAM-dependent methyltransferase [Lachnospiraceae bacterium]